MILESLRTLLYPLGFVANALFSYRVIQQWLLSERKKKSHVTSSFWILSLIANCILAVHSFIQLQYPVCLIQAFNGVIAWRNLDLMKKNSRSWTTTVGLLVSVFLSTTLLFFLQGWFSHSYEWMRAPTSWITSRSDSLSWGWHLFGIFGMVLFASRFWIQWWLAEWKKESVLSPSFWWVSLFGALASLIYFYRLGDLVNLVSYGFGIIPYLRNLMLLKKKASVTLEKGHLFLFAGEQSGDAIGAELIKALKKQKPTLCLYGVGGPQMRKAGLECLLPMENFQVMGFSAVLKALPKLFYYFHKIRKTILKKRPEAVIFIDYPDFTMRLETSLRKSGFEGRLIHYVSPTVWAWRKSRIKTLSKNLDLLLSIFPFEKRHFSNTSLPVEYVGHPLVHAIATHPYDPDWKKQYSLNSPFVAIFPGSRKHEIEELLPIQLEAASKLNMPVAISVARSDLAPLIRTIASSLSVSCALIPSEHRYELMKDCVQAFATSGTVTLELALHQTPSVVSYQVSGINYFLGRYLFRINLPHYCIVNLLAEKTVFPEYIDRKLSASTLLKQAEDLFQKKDLCKSECEKVKQLLENHDASEKAAVAILARTEA